MFELGFWGLLFWLLVAHAFCDFPLQSDWMVKSKSRHYRQPRRFSMRPDLIWVHVLTGHALIHGGAVALITGQIWLGLLETLAHWLTDYGKSEDWYGFHTDQIIHIGCKVLWAVLWLIS